ncbi:hypothetical protein ABMA57_09825 [Saccharospirillum sp. HFRX-1]|uniref:hypothetical protein n=1 Tax=unclassified Saccharospirillum TaxID=2633430 RepID=UPI00371BC804
MLICWLFYIHIPLLNAATMTPTVWMVICSSQGVHWVQVDLGSDEAPSVDDGCDCLLKQMDTASVVVMAPPKQRVVVAEQTPVVFYDSTILSHYSIRAPPAHSSVIR